MKRAHVLFAGILAMAQAMVQVAEARQFNDGIVLGNPIIGGTGCPGGSASATVSPDGSAISVLFDNFVTQAQGATRVDRKACSIAIPVHVPQGFSVSVIQVDYRGFNSLPSGARSQFNAEYFFAGRPGPRFSERFAGPLQEDYTVSTPLQLNAMVWSACGADTNLRANASIMTTTNFRGEQAMTTVDSADISSGIIYKLQWKRCN